MGRTVTNVQRGRGGRGGRNATPPPTLRQGAKAGKATQDDRFKKALARQVTMKQAEQAEQAEEAVDDEPKTPPPRLQLEQPPPIDRGQNGRVPLQLQVGEGRVLFFALNMTPGQLGGRVRPRKLIYPRQRRNAVDIRPPPFKLEDVMVVNFSLMSVRPHHPDCPADDEMES